MSITRLSRFVLRHKLLVALSWLVVAVVGSLGAVELDALGALTAHGTVVMVATRTSSQPPPALVTLSGLVAVDASRTPFPTAWNQAMTRWHLAPPPRSPRSRSPR